MILMRYAFEELNLVRVDNSWIEYNTPSIKLCEKCGWKIEEKALFRGGQYYSLYFGGILYEDFLEAEKKLYG